MDVFRAREDHLRELAAVENALLHLEFSVPDVPARVWVEHSRLSVRPHQLAMEMAMDPKAAPADCCGEGGGR